MIETAATVAVKRVGSDKIIGAVVKANSKEGMPMAPEDQKTKVRRVTDEVYHKGNVNALDEIVATDFVAHQPPGPDIKGLDSYKRYATEARKAYSDLRFTINEYIGEGEVESMRYTLQGTHTGQSPSTPVPPTGKRVTITGLLMTRTAGGKAVEQWNYMDMLGLMQQLGAAPPMGKAGG